MPKEIIIRFNYQNKEFVVFVENNQINFGYQENNQIYTNLTKEEQNLIGAVYSSLTINKETSIDCGIFKIRNKQINIFYDLTSKLYFFYEKINNELKIPSKEDLIMLNTYYNNQNEFLKSKDKSVEKVESYYEKEFNKKMVRRSIKINSVWIAVIISSLLAFQNLPQLGYGTYYLMNKSFIEKERHIDEYSYDKLKEIIQENDKLSEEEKSFILNIEEMLEENKQFIESESLYDNLKNLDIIYHKESHDNASGTYSYDTENINLYEQPNFFEADKKVLLHELNHAIYNSAVASIDFKYSHEKADYLMEAINELYTIEYYEKMLDMNLGEKSFLAYETQMQVLYPLCEILDIETIKKFQYDRRMSYIIEDLLSIDNDIKKAGELITAINSMELYEDNLRNSDSENIAVAMEEREQNNSKIYNLIKHYYEKKYNRDMTEDQLMMFYLHGFNEETNEFISLYKFDDNGGFYFPSIKEIKYKGYISEYYKNKYPDTKINYTLKDKEYTITITDENRYSKEPIKPDEVKVGYSEPEDLLTKNIDFAAEEENQSYKTR